MPALSFPQRRRVCPAETRRRRACPSLRHPTSSLPTNESSSLRPSARASLADTPRQCPVTLPTSPATAHRMFTTFTPPRPRTAFLPSTTSSMARAYPHHTARATRPCTATEHLERLWHRPATLRVTRAPYLPAKENTSRQKRRNRSSPLDAQSCFPRLCITAATSLPRHPRQLAAVVAAEAEGERARNTKMVPARLLATAQPLLDVDLLALAGTAPRRNDRRRTSFCRFAREHGTCSTHNNDVILYLYMSATHHRLSDLYIYI